MTDARPQHSTLDTRDHLLAIIRLWPDLEARLAAGGSGDQSGVRSVPSSRVPIDAHVSDVIAEVTAWANFLARVLVGETDWRPPAKITTPALLEEIARKRIGHFAENADEMLALAFGDDAKRLHELVTKTIRPSEVRRIRLPVACIEPGCRGKYTTLLLPSQMMQDLVCDKTKTHTIEQIEWQRAYRRADSDATMARDRLAAARLEPALEAL